jgi:hypothetical protein
MMNGFEFRAIDPMALILSTPAYLRWVEIQHPNLPALSKVGEIVRTMNPEEKQFALAKAKVLIAYGKAVEESLK